jgi:hypothetical protein
MRGAARSSGSTYAVLWGAMFTPSELKRRAIDFSREHATDSEEKSDAQNFWRDFLGIFSAYSYQARTSFISGS